MPTAQAAPCRPSISARSRFRCSWSITGTTVAAAARTTARSAWGRNFRWSASAAAIRRRASLARRCLSTGTWAAKRRRRRRSGTGCSAASSRARSNDDVVTAGIDTLLPDPIGDAMSTIEVKVPDIGDFTDVPVIEVLVKPGDTVKVEDSLVTLESDKATMDVPAPAAGVVKSLGVKVGDKVSEGTLLLTLETTAEAPAARPAGTGSAQQAPTERAAPPAQGAPAAAKPQPAPPAAPAATAPRAADEYRGAVDIECQMVVIGSGPGGYSGAFRAADLGLKTVLIERYSTLGGVCLNVGCIPSKALLHAARVIDEAEEMGHFGVTFGKPAIDLAKLRGWKEAVVGKLTRGISGLAKQRKVSVVTGVARFVDTHHLEVSAAD